MKVATGERAVCKMSSRNIITDKGVAEKDPRASPSLLANPTV